MVWGKRPVQPAPNLPPPPPPPPKDAFAALMQGQQQQVGAVAAGAVWGGRGQGGGGGSGRGGKGGGKGGGGKGGGGKGGGGKGGGGGGFGGRSKSLPPFKRVEGTRFVVDGFTCGATAGDVHFLSHFHADHYVGLSKRWTAPIHASAVTAALVTRRLGIPAHLLVVLPMDAPTVVDGARVTLIDASKPPATDAPPSRRHFLSPPPPLYATARTIPI